MFFQISSCLFVSLGVFGEERVRKKINREKLEL